MENHNFKLENPLFQWPFSSSQTVCLPGRVTNSDLLKTMGPFGPTWVDRDGSDRVVTVSVTIPSEDMDDLVGGIPTPLKNMSSSVGMILPNIWRRKKSNVPNHQPVTKFGMHALVFPSVGAFRWVNGSWVVSSKVTPSQDIHRYKQMDA